MTTLKDVLAFNLSAIMFATPEMDSPKKLAARAQWPRGRKLGKFISAREIEYARKRGNQGPSPTLDFIEGVARALHIDPWELLVDTRQGRRHLIDRLIHTTTIVHRSPGKRGLH